MKRLLHVFPSFAVGGVPLRMVRILNHFGPRFSHRIIALDGKMGAAAYLTPELDVSLMGRVCNASGALRSIIWAARFLRESRPDLLLTYNWGAIEWALANRLLRAAPHLHFEAGFGKEEADAQIKRRVLMRRWALSRSCRVVVPSRTLEALARDVWRLPSKMVTYLPNGVEIGRFAEPRRDAFARFPGEIVIGTVTPLRPEKNAGRLLRCFAMLARPVPVRLIVAGDGAEREKLVRLAAELGIADRVVFTGEVRPEDILGSFDIFALSSDTEQMPNALLEAMAAGLAVAAVDVGDVKAIVCEENRRFIVARDDLQSFAAAIDDLLCDERLRRELGHKNRQRAVAEFTQERMFMGYTELFASVGVRVGGTRLSCSWMPNSSGCS